MLESSFVAWRLIAQVDGLKGMQGNLHNHMLIAATSVHIHPHPQAKLSELEQEQEALRNYKAHQVPSTLERPAVPHKPDPKPLTAPHPFNLRSEVSGSVFCVVILP